MNPLQRNNLAVIRSAGFYTSLMNLVSMYPAISVREFIFSLKSFGFGLKNHTSSISATKRKSDNCLPEKWFFIVVMGVHLS
jgi:hypothetical protein